MTRMVRKFLRALRNWRQDDHFSPGLMSILL